MASSAGPTRAPEPLRIVLRNPGIRLDKYIVLEHPEFSRAFIQKLFDQGLALANRRPARPGSRSRPGDEIVILLPPPPASPLEPEPLPLNIVYEDAGVIVVDKPAGLTVHPAPGHPSHTLLNAILSHYPALAATSDSLRPGIVHRLDKDTSGLMVVAKNDAGRRDLAGQFKARSVHKVYLVLVQGNVSPPEGRIEAPVGRHPSERQHMAVVSGGREARTAYRVQEYLDGFSLLEVTLETGRTHQIRVHLAAIGYPVVGDSVYGVKSPYVARQFVHAARLGFRLPSTGGYREFASPLPEDLRRALAVLGKRASEARGQV